MDNEDNNVELEQVEREARTMGWVPEDQFKGNKAHWVDAEQFVEKGRSVMPILQQNNKRLVAEALTQAEKLGKLEKQLEQSQVVLEKLEKHYTEANKRAAVQARQELAAELKQAREDGDTDAEVRILGSISDLKDAEKAAEQNAPEDKKDKSKQQENYQDNLSQDFKAWEADNKDWFGPDKKKTKGVVRAAEDLRDEGSTLVGREFMEAALDKYLEDHPNEQEEQPRQRARPAAKVESSNNRSSVRSGAKSFANLPAEAKAACMDDVDDLVGDGKRFKTVKEWQDRYVKIYFGED